MLGCECSTTNYVWRGVPFVGPLLIHPSSAIITRSLLSAAHFIIHRLAPASSPLARRGSSMPRRRSATVLPEGPCAFVLCVALHDADVIALHMDHGCRGAGQDARRRCHPTHSERDYVLQYCIAFDGTIDPHVIPHHVCMGVVSASSFRLVPR